MKIAVVSANMGGFDKRVDNVPQSVECDFHLFTDQNFPPRLRAMTPRLQARIPKCFSWQMCPNYDYYLWVDSSFSLRHEDSVKWFLLHCQGFDVAVLKHPMRNSIREEADYLKKRLRLEKEGKREPYVIPRYENELIDEELNEILSDQSYTDDRLYASTAFIYHNNRNTQDMLKEWWYHISRYHIVDQLAFPYVISRVGCRVRVIPTSHHNDFKIPYLTLTRYL